MVPEHGTGNGTGGMKETGNVSGRLAGNGTGAVTEAEHWADCWFVDAGGAGSAAGPESTSATDCVGDVAGWGHHLRQPWRIGWVGQAQEEGGRIAV